MGVVCGEGRGWAGSLPALAACYPWYYGFLGESEAVTLYPEASTFGSLGHRLYPFVNNIEISKFSERPDQGSNSEKFLHIYFDCIFDTQQ
eukprot:SAG31_NODE_4764_length_2972_cov_2.026801_3_plen_90_part_00